MFQSYEVMNLRRGKLRFKLCPQDCSNNRQVLELRIFSQVLDQVLFIHALIMLL